MTELAAELAGRLAGTPCWMWFLAAALAMPVANAPTRKALLILTPLLGLASVLSTPYGSHMPLYMFGLSLDAYRLDELSYPFLLAFNVAALIGGLYALATESKLQSFGAALYAGGTMAVAGAGDLLSLVVAWEVMGLSSAILIFARPGANNNSVGLRYLMFQLLSGFLLICGVAGIINITGDARFDYIGIDHISGWLVFLAFGIKCGFPLLHNWISDGYPAATISGAVLLCAFTTKAAIYAMARAFPGTEELLYIGVAMACLPMLFALMENDLRRVLAYSIINQLGFMLCGIATGLATGLNGAVAHAVNDIFFKGLLFMAIGAVLHATGSSLCSDLGGMWRRMPKTAILCIIGAASICAVPPFSGYVSKSLIMDSLLQADHEWAWYGLLLAAALALQYVGLKVPYFAFFASKEGKATFISSSDPPWTMTAAMTMAATICLGAGLFPQQLYSILPYSMEYQPYDAGHVLAQVQLLLFSALAFTWLCRKGLYPQGTPATTIDSDWLWRRLAPAIATQILELHKITMELLQRGTATAASALQRTMPNMPKPLDNSGFVAAVVALLLLALALLLAAPELQV